MKILITGVNGAVGWNLANQFSLAGHSVLGTYRNSLPPTLPISNLPSNPSYFPLDLSNHDAIEKQLEVLPQDIDLIIHCAAMTDVDLCQREGDLAMLINAQGTRKIVKLASERKIFLIYLSTDFVFPGNELFYEEDCSPAPRGIYGASKLEGEKFVLDWKDSAIIRFTPIHHPLRLAHHSKTLISWLRNQPCNESPIKLFDDKTFSPVSSFELFELCMLILKKRTLNPLDARGIWHCCSQEILSVYELGLMIRQFFNLPVLLEKSSFPNNEYGLIRPQNSGLRSTRYPSKSIAQILSQFRGESN